MAADVKPEKFCFKLHELKQSSREASTLNSKRVSKIKKFLEWWRNGDKRVFSTLLSYTQPVYFFVVAKVYFCCSKSNFL